MSLICLVSAKGSPGVTTTALGLAAAIPVDDNRHKLLLEADPAGGSLAIWYQLGRQPGLITLAAAGRHGLTRTELWNHAQELPGGLPVVAAPERADRSSSTLDTSGSRLGRWLADIPDVVAIADCGRLSPDQNHVVAEADLVLLVARPVADQIHPGAALLDRLAESERSVAWLLVGSTPHPADEVERVTGHAVARVLPHDAKAAELLVAGGVTRRLARTPLVREIAALATDLDAQFATLAEQTDDGPGPSQNLAPTLAMEAVG